jgi:SpoVK/Ycf46/Vps4 family AAA+-type ATPase
MTLLESMATPLDWADDVLDLRVRKQIGEIIGWVEHRRPLRVKFRRAVRKRSVLFHGRAGQGQKLAAALLAQACDLPAYRADLRKVLSRRSADTCKRLAAVFERAAKDGAILLLDEADALFAKRTQSRDANDRDANLQTGYLLQRIEDFPGIVILASSMRGHLDEAFARRFQSVIRFTAPASSPARRVRRSGPTKVRPRSSRGRSKSPSRGRSKS